MSDLIWTLVVLVGIPLLVLGMLIGETWRQERRQMRERWSIFGLPLQGRPESEQGSRGDE